MMSSVTLADLHELPAALDLMTSARILGIGRTKAYELARNGDYPCRIIRIGASYVVPTAELLELLGIQLSTEPPLPSPRDVPEC